LAITPTTLQWGDDLEVEDFGLKAATKKAKPFLCSLKMELTRSDHRKISNVDG
jgi:hypothetical protein